MDRGPDNEHGRRTGTGSDRGHRLVEGCWEEIDRAGYLVVAVDGERATCDWAYTIGLHRSTGHPELCLVGIDAAMAGGVLDALAGRVLAGRRFEAGGSVTVGPLHLGLRPVDRLWLDDGDWFTVGRAVLAVRGLPWPSTLQVLWPDDVGEYPEHPGDPRWALRQPLLAER